MADCITVTHVKPMRVTLRDADAPFCGFPPFTGPETAFYERMHSLISESDTETVNPLVTSTRAKIKPHERAWERLNALAYAHGTFAPLKCELIDRK